MIEISKELANLADLGLEELKTFFQAIGEPTYRAEQLIQWVYQLGVRDFELMSNFSLKLKARLKGEATLLFPEIVKVLNSEDGCCKWLFRLKDGKLIETVYIPEATRGTLCCSTQVGCTVGCAFCYTGKMGFIRNLTVGEILGQMAQVIQALSPEKKNKEHLITNLVFMGMGEPLLNYEALVKAAEILLHDRGYGLSKYRVTVSSSGYLPAIKRLRKDTELAFALSLHATTNELRDRLVPMNRPYPLEPLMKELDSYFVDKRRTVTIEYIMLNQVNDTLEDAKRLVKLLAKGNYKVNLIPANLTKNSEFSPSPLDRIDAFRNYLLSHGIATITRKSRGQDIMAACGQLKAEHE